MKHKLSGYAIKGDGTKETAERIRKVFEADGAKTGNCNFKKKFWYYIMPKGASKVCDWYNMSAFEESGIVQIPLTEAERIVFGAKRDELKVGMKVVFTDEAKKELDHLPFRNDIHEISVLVTRNWGLPPGKYTPILNHDIDVKWLRRATITDFLRTLPSDIAERALRQVDTDFETKPCDSLAEALCFGFDWAETEEGRSFWIAVEDQEYDRARAILAENDRVGKWWKHETGWMFFCTREKDNDLYGYGVSGSGKWSDEDDAAICHSRENLTPATPEEVEAMLDKQGCVEIAKSHYVNKAGEVVVEGIAVKGIDKTKWFTWPNDVTPSPDKTEPKSAKQWMMIPTKEAEFIVVWIEDGVLKYKFEKAVEIDGCTTVQIDTNEPQPADTFPRVMWGWGGDAKCCQAIEVMRHDPRFPVDTKYPWKANCGVGFKYAADTHPVTGEPAVKKDAVEQIREVVKQWESQLDNLNVILESYLTLPDSDKNEANRRAYKAEHKRLENDLKQIKEILTKNEK